MVKKLILSLFIMSMTSCVMAQKQSVKFQSDDVQLSGALFKPKGTGPFPAVIFIHGSGPEKASNSFRFAKEFSKKGYVALAYDKRGAGQSEGDPKSINRFSFDQLADDAVAAANFLRTQSFVDPEQIGLFASSQGGWVAPLATSKHDNISFMIIRSASVSTVAEDRLFERAARLKREGFDPSEIKEVTHMQEVDQELSRNGKNFDEFQNLWQQNKEKRWFPRVYASESPVGPEHPYRIWYRTILDFDPLPSLNKLEIPVLWLFGDPRLDRFGPVELSMKRLNDLKSQGKAYTIISYPGADHNLRIGKKDSPQMTDIFNWLNKTLK